MKLNTEKKNQLSNPIIEWLLLMLHYKWNAIGFLCICNDEN